MRTAGNEYQTVINQDKSQNISEQNIFIDDKQIQLGPELDKIFISDSNQNRSMFESRDENQ